MNDNLSDQSSAPAPRRRRSRDRYGRIVKVDKKTGEPIRDETDNLELTLYIKYVTGQKKRHRALSLMKSWAAALPEKQRKDIEEWLDSKKGLPAWFADIDRANFIPWHQEKKSGSAKKSRSQRKKSRRRPKRRRREEARREKPHKGVLLRLAVAEAIKKGEIKDKITPELVRKLRLDRFL